ncbi:MAG: B12-binding domain-containing radical SAM protein [Thaumarchaeota archaeon]|nr:B12-binding domain-containing radical SAM protein [Nitrososphaerota archaeon]
MAKIILTADRAVFTDYHKADALGFGLCLPYRFIPEMVEYHLLAPKIPTEGLRAKFAPYALCKVEASLIAAGFSRRDVLITPPHMLTKAVDRDTEMVGVHVLDPKGLAPVSWTMKVVSGGGKSCTEFEFEKLIRVVKSLKEKYRFKVIVGGPGAWQLRGYEDEYGIDVLFEGESELTFPMIVKKLLDGEDVPRRVRGESVPLGRIPPIVTPSRNGQVQVTRGCPRRCQFCSPTMWAFRSIPLDAIVKEVEFNLKNGIRSIGLVTEDVLLYGAHGLELNPDAVKKLFKVVTDLARRWEVPGKIGFSHISCASALVLKDTVRYISDILGLSDDEPSFPQIGLESGSPRLLAKYFRGKVYPWRPEDWPDMVVESSKLFNDSYMYPCYTYIIGFPDATPKDYVATTELIDRLKDEGIKGWVWPLLLIPMGGTLIEKKATFPKLPKLPKEAIDCLVAGMELSYEGIRSLAPKAIRVKNPLLSKLLGSLLSLALKAMKASMNEIRKDPSVIANIYSKIDIRSTRGFAKAVLPIVVKGGLRTE